jgi:FkbM family methyltransferase
MTQRTSHYLGNSRALTVLRSGIKIIVDTDDVSITPHILADGAWATQVDTVLARHVNRGDKCLDIGCHYGYTALMLAALSAERVVCVDMNQKMTRLCEMNLKVNGFKHLVMNFAIVARDEQSFDSVLYADLGAVTGGNHLTKLPYIDSMTSLANSITVRELVKLSDDIDFVKIDAEGMDWYIFDKLTQEMSVKKCVLEHRPVDAEYHSGADYVERSWQNCVRSAFDTHNVYVIDAQGDTHLIASAEMLLDEEGLTHADLLLIAKS